MTESWRMMWMMMKIRKLLFNLMLRKILNFLRIVLKSELKFYFCFLFFSIQSIIWKSPLMIEWEFHFINFNSLILVTFNWFRFSIIFQLFFPYSAFIQTLFFLSIHTFICARIMRCWIFWFSAEKPQKRNQIIGKRNVSARSFGKLHWLQ